MRIIELTEASRPLAEYIRALEREITVLTDNGEPIAAIVPLEGVDRESLALSGHPEFLELIARSRADFAAGRTLSLAEMKEAVASKRKSHKHSGR